MTEALDELGDLKALAARLPRARATFFSSGAGTNYPIALEGALKLKEISYIHAEGYAAGEMKHGPIALIDDGVPVVVLAPRGPGYEKVLSNLAEVARAQRPHHRRGDARRRAARRPVRPSARHPRRAGRCSSRS